ncbi:tubby-F-box-like protein [Medicago truncatula]|uniref:Tubby-F-box-like protein n=1 Tax=Medicago truncatula TaxID=3880 RepID=G7LES6_MEDTR|nr:tubby-F-box-like protein [Medicago truncatula]
MENVAPDVTPVEPIQQGQWESLLLDLIRRVEEIETPRPARAVEPQQCERITFPISVKQPGPRDHPMQCFIRRNKMRESSLQTFQLYLGLGPSANEPDKLLLTAKRTAGLNFVIFLAADNFSQASKCAGRVRSNFWVNKFFVYDNQPPDDAAVQPNCRSSGIFNNKVSPSPKNCRSTYGRIAPTCSRLVSTISKDYSPRRIHCIMNSIPVSAIHKGGSAPTLTSLPLVSDETFSPSPTLKGKTQMRDSSSAPRWDEQCKGWHLDFKGRVTVASVKNFQFVAAVDPSHNVSPEEQERVILQFGKIGTDIFTMDYSYPLSAFQAFAICLASAFSAP